MSEQWNGEGLPPAGTVCEVRHFGIWQTTTVVGYDQEQPVFKTDWHERYAYACGPDFEFRPIRSAEEVAVEAMEQAFYEKPNSMDAGIKDIYAAIRDGKIPGVKIEENV